jgi:hypothetical protein
MKALVILANKGSITQPLHVRNSNSNCGWVLKMYVTDAVGPRLDLQVAMRLNPTDSTIFYSRIRNSNGHVTLVFSGVFWWGKVG